jgi:hypothetical protein
MDKTERRVEEMQEIQKEAIHLFARKNRDYGDAFAEYGPVGVIVRMGDKIKRLVSISNSGVTLVDNESLRDTLIDLHNYAAMAIMTIDDPNQKENETLVNQSLQFNSSGEGI